MTQLSIGDFHACALAPDAGVLCWGDNNYQETSPDFTLEYDTPVPVPGLGPAVQVAAGDAFSCALLADAGATCWGQLSAYGPVTGLDTLPPLQSIAAGGFACGLASGAVYCWGDDLQTFTDGGRNTSPALISGFDGGVAALSAGNSGVACALKVDGAVLCWGGNARGAVGDGTTIDRPVPVPVLSGATAVAAGFDHSCAALQDGGMACWGANGSGQLGNGSHSDSPTPTPVVGLEAPVVAVSVGSLHTCALLSDQQVECWGDDYYGELGSYRSNTAVPGPVSW
jgi:alpha-tubulin suppressor-like RCC1 family protein